MVDGVPLGETYVCVLALLCTTCNLPGGFSRPWQEILQSRGLALISPSAGRLP